MSSQDFKYTIVVGGGLAGLSACHTIIEHGGNVLLLDKNPFLGGNSTKATSGINGALTEAQIKKKIPDSWQTYAEDTAKSATKGKSNKPTPTQEVLCRESAPAIEWLQRRFGLDLSLVSQLGGQSYPRTHRGPEKFPGMTITYALMEALEKIEKETKGKRAQIKMKARVTKLLTEGDRVIGVEYQKDGKTHKAYGPVVLATGGFGADFTQDGILAKVRPDLLQFSTTNGEHCTGDGIKIASSVGADTIDLEWVQVHPTGLVDPSEPDAKVKFLAAEALRGVGGLLLNADGERFVDELQTRDFVSEQMMKNKPPFRLVLNGKASKEIEWHCKHYVGRGLMKKLTGEQLAKEIGIPVSKLKETFDKYNKGAREKKDEFGKKHFHNLPFEINDTFHVAQVCPLVHYCMGGLKIDEHGRVLSKKTGKPIPGLFAAGEVAGGVHGKNRLGGSSLTDCVVYGRVSGRSAAYYGMRTLLERKPSAVQVTPSQRDTTVGFTIKQDPVETSIEIKPLENNVLLNVKWRGGQGTAQTITREVEGEQVSEPASTDSQPQPQSGSEEEKPKEKKRELKVYTAEEVAKHNTESDCWVIVNGQVLDVTNFLDQHPGGKKAILLYAGRDATEEFNMLHDKGVIEKYAPDTIIGTLAGANVETSSPSTTENKTETQADDGTFNARVYAKTNEDYLKPNNPISLKPIEPTQPSNKPSRNSGGTADILPQERKKATFDVKKMTIFLDGGEEKHARKHFIMSPIIDVDYSDMHNWDRHTYIKKHVDHFIKVHKKFANYQPAREEIAWMSDYYVLKGSFINHHGLFVSTIQGMASDEQKEWWLKKAMRFEIIGCYAQTELGHGSNVRGLQTVATYDKEKQQFVLNTPTLTSIKWWPGTLGKLATHALVYAQLILDGKEYGVHVFMVQIRDENHRPLPGIELGDLGAKLGDHANDTGFMRMENVRIPRTHMLARYQYVTPDGKYQKTEKKLNPKLHYATMMYTRGWMIGMGAGVLAKASTIATRYSCVRKQGFKNPTQDTSYKSEEFQIIDYQVQRYRVLRQVALTYVLKFTANWMQNKFADLEGGKDKKKLFIIEDVSALPEIAATSAGLKALTTFIVAQGVEDLRKSCGGNGYLMSSGLAPLAADYVWQTTAEGDFIIMMLLTARFLLKSLQKARKEQVSGPVDYLNIVRQPGFNVTSVTPPQPTSWQQLLDLDYLQSLFKFRALMSVIGVGTQFAKRTAKGENFMNVWNSLSLELINAVRNHCWYFMLRLSVEKAATADDPKIREVLKQLVQLYAISNILDDNWAGFLSEKQVRFAKQANTYLLDKLRPNAVALVDAFEIPDNVLNSVIGRYDGNVYEALFEDAKKSELNRVDPFIGYEEVLRPHLDREFLKNGNNPIKSKM